MFRMDVAKVDRNGAYAAMAIHACCKSLFQKFRLFLGHILQVFYLDVAYVSHICCKCFIWILHTLATACKCFRRMLQVLQTYVASVSDVCCKCFSCLRRILQVFHLDIVKVDLVLHMLQWDPPAPATCCSCWGATERAQTVPACGRVVQALRGREKWGVGAGVLPNVRTLAIP